MQKFVSVLSVKNQNDAAGLRKLFDQVESSVRNLRLLKVEKNSYGSLLASLLNEKLVNDMRERTMFGVWYVKFLEKRAGRERSFSVGATFSGKCIQSFDNEVFSSLALLNQSLTSNHRKERRRVCVFYGLSNHKSHRCLKVKNSSAWKKICKKNKNCFVCFKIGHNANLCSREDYKCKSCNGKHNFSICTFNKNLLQSRVDYLINWVMLLPIIWQTTKLTFCRKTAFVKVSYLNLQKQSKVNVLLDTCSQRKYLSNDMKNYLNLPVLRKEHFGTEDTCVKTVDTVPLKITSPIKTIVTEAICMPAICSNILNEDVKTVPSNYEDLKWMELADSSRETTKCIDVLMGVDYYYSCITAEVKRGKDYEPLPITSCCGWIVCGYYNKQTSVSTNFVNSAHMLCTNTELLNTFNDDLKKHFHAENYKEEINEMFIYHSKRIYVLIIKKRDTRHGFRDLDYYKIYQTITI